MAHRAKVFAALSRHSDPALREIGRLLAAGAASPQQLRDDPLSADKLRRIARKLKEMDPETRGPGAKPSGSATQQIGPDGSPDGSGAQPVPVGTPSIRPGTQPDETGAQVDGAAFNVASTRADDVPIQFVSTGAPILCRSARSTGSSHDRSEADRAHEAGPARETATPTRTMVREVCQPSGGEPTRPAR
jgi:hypothetical protein